MLDINSWMNAYIAAVRAAFGDRVQYVGLQGSRGREEAGPDSDIDVVCILDACSLRDLETYRAAVADLPDRAKLCGFVSGAAELAAWDPADLFQFRHDPADWSGPPSDLLPPDHERDARGARPPPCPFRRPASASPPLVVFVPPPAGVGLMAVIKITLPSALSASFFTSR